MLMISLVLFLMGSMFLLGGSLIFFGKDYSIITNFEVDRRRGKYDDNYAMRFGLILLIFGLISIALSILSFILKNENYSISFLLFCLLGTLITLIINMTVSNKERHK